MAQIKFRSADEVERHRCPGDCPNDFFAFFIGSDESKRQFEEKYPHPADKVLVEASKWLVQMEIDRGMLEIAPPINILQITKHGKK